MDTIRGEESILAATGEPRSKRARPTTENNNSTQGTKKKRKSRSGRTETRASRERRENSQKQAKIATQRREERRKKRKEKKKSATNADAGPRVVCNDDEGRYYEVEKVVGKRMGPRGIEWKIRWKGCPESEDSWEPDELLSDSASEEAFKLFGGMKDNEEEGRGSSESSTMAGIETLYGESEARNLEDTKLPPEPKLDQPAVGDPFNPYDGISMPVPPPQAQSKPDVATSKPEPNIPSKPRVSSRRKRVTMAEAAAFVDEELPSWTWTDQEQVVFRSITRINVNDTDAHERVTEARVNGTPVVLVGHKGWANFAKPWLLQSGADAQVNTNGTDQKGSSLLDLSLPHQLNLVSMVRDIGQEDVPIVNRDYDEENPTKCKMPAREFLLRSASDFSSAVASDKDASKDPKMYLHQWQFPLSETAGTKLCHKNNPLPNEIFGVDLLRFLLGREDGFPQCELDNPYQYLFMGAQGTMSKLHRDKGGLAITIAPIVGEKECILVHRSDGIDCLYNLDADLDEINLNKYPLMAQARIWKTVVYPGEILLMPQGTYHQCRNLTACLSYSRFHLDTVNVRAFFQSMMDGDAPEIDHETILYNAADALVDSVGLYVERVQQHVKNPKKYDDVPLSNEMIRTVKTLRCLRNICREIDRRRSVQTKVKGRSISAAACHKEDEWAIMTGQIDAYLHDFHFRRMKTKPRFRPKIWDDTANMLDTRKGDRTPIVADTCGSTLERAFLRLPDISDGVPPSIQAEPSVNDLVTVHLMGKSVKGEIIEIKKEQSAALLKYEEFPSVFDEYQPYDSLRVPRSGESAAEVKSDDVKPGLVVVTKAGSEREGHRAVVASIASGTFYHVRLLNLGKKVPVARWFTRESIVTMDREPKPDTHGSLTNSEGDAGMHEVIPQNVESQQGLVLPGIIEGQPLSVEDRTKTGTSTGNMDTPERPSPISRVVIGVPGQGSSSSSSDADPSPSGESISSLCSQQ